VEYRVDARTGGGDGLSVAEIGLDGLEAQPIELGVSTAAKSAHAIAAGNKLFDEIQAEESPGPGYKTVQGWAGRCGMVAPTILADQTAAGKPPS
jgi:hypothetical protein